MLVLPKLGGAGTPPFFCTNPKCLRLGTNDDNMFDRIKDNANASKLNEK